MIYSVCRSKDNVDSQCHLKQYRFISNMFIRPTPLSANDCMDKKLTVVEHG